MNDEKWVKATHGDKVLLTLKAPLKGALQGTIKTIETINDDGIIKRKGISLGAPDDCVVYLDYADIEEFYIIQPGKEDLATWVDPYEDYAAVKVEASDPMIKHHIIAEKWSDHMWHIVGETKTFSWEGLLTYYSNVSATQAKITPLYLHPKDD